MPQAPTGVGHGKFVAEIREVGGHDVDQGIGIGCPRPFLPHVLANERVSVDSRN